MNASGILQAVNKAIEGIEQNPTCRNLLPLNAYVTASRKVNVRDLYGIVGSVELTAEDCVTVTDRTEFRRFHRKDSPYDPLFRRIGQEIEGSGLNVTYA